MWLGSFWDWMMKSICLYMWLDLILRMNDKKKLPVYVVRLNSGVNNDDRFPMCVVRLYSGIEWWRPFECIYGEAYFWDWIIKTICLYVWWGIILRLSDEDYLTVYMVKLNSEIEWWRPCTCSCGQAYFWDWMLKTICLYMCSDWILRR